MEYQSNIVMVRKGRHRMREGTTRQKFSFALRLDVSTPNSPSLRLSRLLALILHSDQVQLEMTMSIECYVLCGSSLCSKQLSSKDTRHIPTSTWQQVLKRPLMAVSIHQPEIFAVLHGVDIHLQLLVVQKYRPSRPHHIP